MKKTDAINAIENWLSSNDPRMNNSQSASDRKVVAEGLLEELMKIGMAPPLLDEEKQQAILDTYYAGFSLRQWDEDFEKDEKAVDTLQKRRALAQRKAERAKR